MASSSGHGIYDQSFFASPLTEGSAPSSAELRQRYEKLLEQGKLDYDDLEENMRKLKELVLAFNVPEDEKDVDLDKESKLRGKVWQILLGMRNVDVQEYMDLLKDGIPEVKNEVPPGATSMFGSQATSSQDILVVDANRTFSLDAEFTSKVPFEKIVRVLSAFHRKIQKRGKYMGYIQGINAIAGCFLYNMPEVEAWSAMCIMIEKMCPRYCGLYGGSYDGDVLVRRIIEVVDPTLAARLVLVPLTVFTHQVLHGLCTVYPPLSEVLKLWDLILAFGVHMSTIFAACMVVLRRNEILSAEDPNFFIQKGAHPPTDAAALIRLAVHIIPLIPPKLFALCAAHHWKPLALLEQYDDPLQALDS